MELSPHPVLSLQCPFRHCWHCQDRRTRTGNSRESCALSSPLPASCLSRKRASGREGEGFYSDLPHLSPKCKDGGKKGERAAKVMRTVGRYLPPSVTIARFALFLNRLRPAARRKEMMKPSMASIRSSISRVLSASKEKKIHVPSLSPSLL